MAQEGTPVTRTEYKLGTPKQSLEAIALKIREGRLDAAVMGWARGVLKDAGLDGRDRPSVRSQLQALLDEIRKTIIWSPDPANAEVVQSAAGTLCLRPGLCLNGGDCFPQGTLLLRDDYSFIKIEEVQIGDRIWGRDKWTTVDNKWFKGPLTTDALILNNGSTLQLTSDHHIYVARCPEHEEKPILGEYGCSCPIKGRRIDRIRLRDAKPKDVLIAPERLAFGQGQMDPDKAYVEGLYISDGWSEEYRFSISGQDGEPKEAQKLEVKTICDRLGVETYWHRKHIRVKDSEWTLRMQQMGLHAPEKHFLSIDLDEAAAAASLRGAMADSGANTHGNGRTFTTTSKLLATQVRVLHKMFGVTCSTRYIENHGGLGKNPIYRLGVRDPYSIRQKLLRIKAIERGVAHEIPCWDISTHDRYVYLPEHDLTVSNCDDQLVVIGSGAYVITNPATLQSPDVAIVRQKIQGQAQEHVLVAVKDENNIWLYADPSLKDAPVGARAPGVIGETFYDPLAPIPAMGVGEAPAEMITMGNFGVGVGDRVEPNPGIEQATKERVAATQLQEAMWTLRKAAIELKAELNGYAQTRRDLGASEFEAAQDIARGPSEFLRDSQGNILWTPSIVEYGNWLLSLSDRFLAAGSEAYSGARAVTFDEAGNLLLRAFTSDKFRYLLKTKSLQIIDNTSGVTLGEVDENGDRSTAAPIGVGVYKVLRLDPEWVKKRPIGMGSPVLIGLAIFGAVVFLVASYFMIAKLCELLTNLIREKANVSIAKLCSEKDTPVDKCLKALEDNRAKVINAEAEKQKTDPFAQVAESAAGIMKLLIVGAGLVGAFYVGKMVWDEVKASRHGAKTLVSATENARRAMSPRRKRR